MVGAVPRDRSRRRPGSGGPAPGDERDIPVVALKVGRDHAAPSDMVAAHSGALAGEDGAYEALFDAYGVLRVESHRRDARHARAARRPAGARARGPGRDPRLAAASGRLHHRRRRTRGRPVHARSATRRQRLDSAALEPGLPPVNPLDAWGTGNDADAIFIECMRALLDDPGTAALAFSMDLTTELVPTGYTLVAREVFARTAEPVAVLSNVTSAIDPRDAGAGPAPGIPVLEGTEHRLPRSVTCSSTGTRATRPPRRAARRRRLRSATLARPAGGRRPFDEAEALALLAGLRRCPWSRPAGRLAGGGAPRPSDSAGRWP